MKKRILEAQEHLRSGRLDGWLLYDFHKNNDLAHLFLQIPSNQMTTRRFFYWIPQEGEPVKIVHAIEAHILDQWPGEKRVFSSWQSLEKELGALLTGKKKIAMEYSPRNRIPYVSKVDAGTVDLVRSFGVEVVSSGSFLPHFTAVLNENQAQSHIRAGQALDQIARDTWAWLGERLKKGQSVLEYDVQQKIVADFASRNLITESPPIAAVNGHSADPHYVPQKEGSAPIRKGDFVLIDLWAKEPQDGAVFGDITRVAVAADKPSLRQQEVFSAVRQAQRAATELVKNRFAAKKAVFGYEVDDAAREVIRKAGYGEFFIHRTGHSIEVHLHGSGAHMDNLEMHDERPILPGTCFSIEPGIYLPDEFGVRLEYDLYIHPDGVVEITGGEQDAITLLL